MRQSKFSLADLITLITAFLFSVVCSFGTYFYTLGNTGQSLILAVIIFVLLVATALGAKLLKRTSRNFKTCFIFEIILLVLFTGLMILFSYSPFPHYFVVSEKRTEIQSKLSASITQAEKMFAEYERYAGNRESLYENKLNSVVAAKRINPGDYAKYGFENNNVSDEKQIENKMFTVHADLFPSNYIEMKSADSTWLLKEKHKLNNWWTWNLGVVDAVNNMETNSNKWLNELEALSKVCEQGEQAEDFRYNLSFDDIAKYFTTLGSPTLLSIGLAVVAWALMLLSWFITERHPRFPGLKVLFGSGKSSRNEL